MAHDDAENRGPAALATTVIVTCIAAAIVLTRLFIRLVLVRASGWDDWIILIAFVAIAAMTITISKQVEYGLGRHLDTLTSDEVPSLFFYFWISIIFYNIGLGLTKASIVMQYMRIFATTRAMRMAINGTMVFIVLYTMEAVLLSIFSCTPVPHFWHRDRAGSCVNFKALWFSHAALNIFSDVLIIMLPMPTLKGLNVPKRQKVALMGIFALGAFGCVTSILRLKSLYAVADSTDVSYDNVDAAVWSNVEINVAVMCASLPTFKALLKRLFPHLLSTDQASRSQVGNNYAGHNSRSWRSRTGRGPHSTIISLDGLERGEGGHRGRPSKKDGVMQTTIEKGTASYAGSDGDSSHEDSGIKVVTVMSQRLESPGKAGAEDGYTSEAHSISESERKFFPHK